MRGIAPFQSSFRLMTCLAVLWLSACAALPSLDDRSPSYALPAGTQTAASMALQPLLAEHPGQSGFRTLADGEDAFIARIRIIDAAQKTVDAQYYIWHDDGTGRVLRHRLVLAADRGVRVRLLLDDLDTAGKDQTLRTLDFHPNIEVRVFNPFANRAQRVGDFVGDTARINRRMHNKTLTVDGQLSIFGGRNIGNEYFAAGEELGFGDMDALAIGPVAAEINSQFDLYWNSAWAYPISSFDWDSPISDADLQDYRATSANYMEEARQSEYAAVLQSYELSESRLDEIDWVWSEWVLVYDQPEKVVAREVSAETHLAPRLKQGLDRTRSDLVIVSPYFVPGEWFTDYLTGMVERGVRVRVLTNSLAANDVALVHAGYMRYREDLLRGGVELYEYRADADQVARRERGIEHIGASRASLHGKFFGFDKTHIFIGSFNLDGRSTRLNTELGVYYASPQQALKLSEGFDSLAIRIAYRLSLDESGGLRWTTLNEGVETSIDHEPDTSGWMRFKTKLLSWIVPESQL